MQNRVQPHRRCKRARCAEPLDPLRGRAARPRLSERETEESEAEETAWSRTESAREDRYWRHIGRDRRAVYHASWKAARRNPSRVPYLFRLLSPALPAPARREGLERLEQLKRTDDAGECAKGRQWLDGLLRIPFGTHVSAPTGAGAAERLCAAHKALESAVHGHTEAKESILHLVAQEVSAPRSKPPVIGLQGPMGNGKTTLVREGVAKALCRPFAQVSLGGASDAAMLQGHSYTYEGSRWGRLVQVLMDTRCMNPIVYFDELDKLGGSDKGRDLEALLIHLTDDSQNSAFHDKYFDGIEIDMSRALFIFSFNHESAINPILRDRLTIIRTQALTAREKHHIAEHYLVPRTLRNLGLPAEHVRFLPETGPALVAHAAEERGVRRMKQLIECVLSRILTLSIDPPGAAGDDRGYLECLPPGLRGLRLCAPVPLTAPMVGRLARRDAPPTYPAHMYT